MLTQEELKRHIEYDPKSGLWKWRVHASGRSWDWFGEKYLSKGKHYQFRINGRLYYAHRLAWLYVYGEWPEELDHINRNGADNRISNLRVATKTENQINKGPAKNNNSGVVGVFYRADRPRSPWMAQIRYKEGKMRKSFATKGEATVWRKLMELALYGERIFNREREDTPSQNEETSNMATNRVLRNYDPACETLAEHFLQDEPDHIETDVYLLAKEIQDAIENWLNYDYLSLKENRQ